jgi:protocatechuate 3,4-dioxygenase beta subunit
MSKNLLILIGIVFLLVVGFFGFRNFAASDQATTPQSQNIQASAAPAQSVNTSTESASVNCSGRSIPALAEGPYYTPNTPQKVDLTETGIPGEKLVLTGYILDTGCKPIANAWIDFWQANGEGNYDNLGYKLRGHQFSDANGRYTLTTVIPGEYPGRTPHIHFKIRASENSPVITSQLFIPGVAGNETDTIYDESLLISNIQQTADGKSANFNFVIEK